MARGEGSRQQKLTGFHFPLIRNFSFSTANCIINLLPRCLANLLLAPLQSYRAEPAARARRGGGASGTEKELPAGRVLPSFLEFSWALFPSSSCGCFEIGSQVAQAGLRLTSSGGWPETSDPSAWSSSELGLQA